MTNNIHSLMRPREIKTKTAQKSEAIQSKSFSHREKRIYREILLNVLKIK